MRPGQARCKVVESQCKSLESRLTQTTNENEELTKICDELIEQQQQRTTKNWFPAGFIFNIRLYLLLIIKILQCAPLHCSVCIRLHARTWHLSFCVGFLQRSSRSQLLSQLAPSGCEDAAGQGVNYQGSQCHGYWDYLQENRQWMSNRMQNAVMSYLNSTILMFSKRFHISKTTGTSVDELHSTWFRESARCSGNVE